MLQLGRIGWFNLGGPGAAIQCGTHVPHCTLHDALLGAPVQPLLVSGQMQIVGSSWVLYVLRTCVVVGWGVTAQYVVAIYVPSAVLVQQQGRHRHSNSHKILSQYKRPAD